MRRKLSALPSLFNHLRKVGTVAHNPVEGVGWPRTETAEGKTSIIGDHQARAPLDAPSPETLKGKRDRAILATLLYHGPRCGGLCALRVRDLEGHCGVLQLRVHGNGSYGRGQGTVQDTATQGVAMYKRAGLVILITFTKGHAVLVTYLKKGRVFDDTEREKLLAENRRGSAWESLGDEKGGTVFRTKDKKISAYAKNNQLSVMAQGTNPEAQRAGQ